MRSGNHSVQQLVEIEINSTYLVNQNGGGEGKPKNNKNSTNFYGNTLMPKHVGVDRTRKKWVLNRCWIVAYRPSSSWGSRRGKQTSGVLRAWICWNLVAWKWFILYFRLGPLGANQVLRLGGKILTMTSYPVMGEAICRKRNSAIGLEPLWPISRLRYVDTFLSGYVGWMVES